MRGLLDILQNIVETYYTKLIFIIILSMFIYFYISYENYSL